MAENRFLQSPIDKLIEESKSYELPKIELPARSEPRSAAQSMRTNGLMPPQNFQPIFEEASAEYGVPLNVLAALGQQESSYNPGAVGQKTKWGRAKGLMQYLDSTASSLGINPFDAKQSIHAAAKQLRERLDKGYTLEEAIMAHHGGDNRKQWGPKTRQYVQDVMGKAGKIGQVFMQNAPQTAASEEFDLSAIQAELDAQEPGRFKVLSPEEAERYQRRENLIGGQGQLQAAQDALKPGAPSPLTIENQQRAAESTPPTAPSPLTPENQIRVENGLPPKDTRPYQGFLEATGNALSNVPERFQQSIAGLIQMAGEDLGLERERFIAQRAQQYGITPGDMKLLAWAGNQKLIDPKAQVPQALEYVKKNIAPTLNDQQLKELAAAGIINPDEITAYAKQWREDTKKTMAEVRPEPGSAAFYGSAAISSLAEMAPMIAGAIITRSPTVAMGIMGGQVGGQSYAEAREKGLSEEQAQTYAVLTAAAEAAPEALVVGRLLKPGAGVVRKVLEGTVMEGAQEAVTAALQAGIDKQMIDPNMTLREALVQIRDSTIIGKLGGGGMGGVVAGAESLANRGQRTQQERIEPTIDGGTPGPTQSDTTPQSAAPATPASEAPQQVPPAAVNDNAAPAAQQAAPQPPKGPLSRAAERVIQQSGEPVTVVAPDGEVAGTLESYVDQGNGRWTARVTAEDGNTYDFTHEDGVDIVRSQTAAQPEPEAIEEASAIEEPAAVEQPAMPEQGAADTAPVVNPQLTTEQPSSQRTPLLSERIQAEAEKGLDQMSEAELRGELKAVAKQAKELEITKESPREVRNEHARLTKRRKAIEQAIKALTRPKQEEPVSAAKEIVERPKVEPTNSLQGEPASWVIRNKETGEVIMETFDKKKVDALNTEKYEAVPIQQHLGELNQKIKAGDEATVKESLTAGQPASAPQVGQSVVLGKGRQQGTITEVGDGFVKVKQGARTEKMDLETFGRRIKAAGQAPEIQGGDLQGKDIDGDWTGFAGDSGTLNIPRADMPQIKAEHRGAMVNFLNARGIEHQEETVPAVSLKPTQAEFSKKKVAQAKEFTGGDRSILVSRDGHVLDGHHQWIARRDNGEDVKIIRLDAPIRELLTAAHEFPSSTTASGATAATPAAEAPATEDKQPKAEPKAEAKTEKPAGYGASNKLVTADRAAELRARLKAKLNGSQLNSGIDPEILAMGTELAVFHIEAGVRRFADFARTMAADLDMPMEKIRPYLRSFYNGARDMMEDANLSIEGMDGPDEVRAALRQLDAGDAAPAAPAAKRETVSTPAGREFEVQHKVIEADELVTSNDAAGAINPDYPKELQPRDRSRSASLDQINDIASKLNPRLLGESASATDGAPIVSTDNVVESGNGRTLAIRQAYARGMADRYREWLASQGYDVAGMKAPVLVRERVTPMTMEERIAYTTEANDRTTLELSSTERALSDARKMGPILHLYRGGDLQAAANRDFVRAFVGDVAAKADRGRILDGDGMLSQDGRRRIEAALLGSAYGDETLITDLFESADTDIKAIGGALLDVAGSWAKMREDAREGVISESVDTTPNLLEAVNLIRRARAEGRPILELVRQNDFFSGELDPVTLGFMSIFYRGESFTRARGRDKVAGELRYYTEQAQLSQPGTNMFGDPEVTGAEILRGTNDRLQRQEQQAGQQQDIFASPRTDGANAGAPGTDGQGPQPEAASQAPAQGGLNAPGSRERVERDRPDAGAAQPVVQAADGDAAGQDAEGAGQAGRGADGEQGAGQRDQRLPGDGATAGRERGDQPAYRADGQFQPESSTAGDPERTGSGGDSIQGQIVEQEREEAVADDAQAPGAGDLDQRLAAQRKAQNAPTKWGDKASIDAALPLLLPEQRDDVLKAEQRLAGHNGILYTNGTGTGKAQPLDAKILTPRGWVRMGDIQVGDEVISVDGTPTKVLGVYPQGEKGIYRVTFDDGSSTECCDEHLWLTQTLYERRKASKNPEWNCAKPKVRELSEIRATLDKRHFIPVVAPVQLQGDISQNLLPAYTLGVILGDGDLVGGSLRFTNPDEEVASRVAAELPASMGMVKQESDERCVSYRLTNSENGTEADGTFSKGAVRIELERLGLHGTDSFGKFIPREYLSAKIADRIALLQGLMDTDGTADERTNSAYFTTVSPSLKDDFVELVQSLGGVARVSEKVPTYTYRGERRTGQKAYTVNVVLPEGIDPFSLPRKADKLKPRTWGQVRRKIVSVDFVGEKAAQCIAVEHESHLYVTDNYIVTHNTATGLGVAKRFINDGKDNIVIVVPSDKIASDWVKFARMLGVELKQLADTNDNGKTGPIVTTYANFGQNESLAQRDWDLVIADESHYLSSNEGGDKTAALEQLRALTGHHDGFYRWVRQRHAKEWQAFSAAMQDRADANGNPDVPMERYIALEAAEAKAREKWNAIEQPAREKWNQRWAKQDGLPKTVMLSATPFAYAKNVDYAEGYLFHYVEPADLLKSQGNVGGYNSGSPRDRFLMQHFGYRMRYNKLTAPESGVNSQLMEQQFNQWLKSTGALSGRRLEVAHDYDRKFVLVDDAVGTKIDEGLKYLREAEEGRYREVYEAVSKQFDYQRRMYLLESMKARAAVPIIREHLALGRKIVVFHDFNKGGGFNPFNDAIREIIDQDVKSLARSVLGKPMFKLDFSGLFSPIETLGEAFPDALFFNGTVSKGQRRANADLFNDDDSGRNLIVVQSDAGREGVSLHDTTGRHQRVEINLGMPVKPVAATQIEGRIYRTGQASDAIFRYLTTGTAWEAAAFASKIAERASTAENLALGEEARGLKEAFIDAYQNADAFPASAEDGKGGKDYDRKLSAAFTTSPFDRAKTFYWAQQKNSKRRDQREGQDYFATPEPVGFKMVEWANIQPNDKALEPSAGHGAIARFFPEQSDVTMVEPSYELSQRAALANGNARIVNDRFEQLHINNKFDAIVMNPPYGSGGKTSTEHLAKAAKHLRDGGRIVALIPRGGLADKRLDAFLESEEAADLYTVAKIAMPAVTFERAGTAVNTQVLVLEKHANAADADGILQRNIDLSNAESVNELFDRIESLSLPDRQPTSTPEPKQEIVEHTTAKGKVLRGIIRTDLTQDAAKEIDPYTFRKKNAAGETGWFIRAKHLDQGPRYSVAATRQTETPAFKRWFGDSKVVDAEGKPLVVYHGTAADFSEFSAGEYGKNFTGDYGVGFYFTQDPKLAARYATNAGFSQGDQGGNVMPVYLSMKNPKIVKAAFGDGDLWRSVPGANTREELTEGLKAQGYDGVIVDGGRAGALYVKEAVAFYPEQIKSAVGNNGDFDPSNPDIRYSVQDGDAPLSVNQVRAAITRGPFGRIVDKMVEKGLIAIHSNSSTLPKDMGRGKRGVQAVTEPGGKVHLVASNLTQQNANAVLLHEMFHSGVESLVGSKRWADLQGRLGSLYRQAEQSRGKAREIFDRARARVADAKAQGAVARRMEVEEFGAYAIEEYESMPSAFRKWVDDLVGAIKAWMFSRYGRQIGQVTPAQLRALAKDALITIALHRRGELFGPIAERFSATRITETPAFKRWFGESKVVDENGEPLVVYHGSPDVRGIFAEGFKAYSRGSVFFAAADYAVADSYADDRRAMDYQNAEPQTIPLYLSIKNPMIVDAKGAHWRETERHVREAKDAGHDGIIIKNSVDFYNNPKGRGKSTTVYAWFDPTQAKSAVEGQLRSRVDRQPIAGAIGNNGDFDPSNPDIRYSVRPSEAFNDLNQSQKDFLDKIGPTRLPQRLRDRFDQLTDNLGLRIRQAGVDRYAALLRNDQALLGADTLEGSIASSAWVLARMSHAAGGAVTAMMDAGRIYLDPKEKVIDVREGTQGLAATLRSLGSPVEIDRFMGWIAANRANKLFKQGRENLFSHSEIEAGMKLSGGKLENGKSRSILYAKAWKELQQHRDDVLGIAEQAGLLKPAMTKPDAGLVIARKYEAPAAIIKQLTEAKNALDAARTPDMLNTAQQKVDMANDALLDWLKGAVNGMKIDMLNTPQDRLDAITQELEDLQRSQRELWSEEFYVPFYRVIDEDSIGGPRAGSGLSRQQAYKKLKGGKQHLNDLLDNTLLNFHHLIQASLKNQAAAQAMANAEALGIAEKTTEAKRDKKASTYVMVDGEKQWYDVSDPLTFKAVSALSSAGLNTPVMKVGRAFKRFFTNMTTITPQFVVANGLRDTLSAMATSPTSSVPFKTAFKGALTYWNDQSKARMMASGGAFSFGHVYGQNADEIKASLTVSMRKAKVLRDPKLIPGALLTAWRKYHAVTDFAENINRAGIWERNLEKGKLKAAFEARDLMDFSAHGDAIAIRILTDLVPFLNARIQGLDKLYRAGFKPGSKVAMGKGTKADRQAFARFLAVTGALTLASTLLFLNNYDDDEYRKLEDWQRDTYWIIRIGDEMFFIPKPFEVGAIATMGERLAEQFVDPAVGGEKFAQRLGHMLTDTFAFDPTPQLVKPAVEVFWKNKDSFTGRPIEDQYMERLSPSLRSRPDTSRLADAASRGMEAAAGAVGGQDLALSPVQIDHLIRGYTGSVGATAVATADTLWRRAMGEELPARRWHEYQPIKRFYRDLTQEPTYTRYGTDFYEALKKADRAYSSLMHLRKYDEARAKKYESEHDRELKLRDMLKLPRREITQINAEMKKVQMDKTKSGESKRLELDRLRSQRNMIMQQVGEDLEREAIRRRAAAD